MKNCPTCNSTRFRETETERICEKCGYKNLKEHYEKVEIKSIEEPKEETINISFEVTFPKYIINEINDFVPMESFNKRIKSAIFSETQKIYSKFVVKSKLIPKPSDFRDIIHNFY